MTGGLPPLRPVGRGRIGPVNVPVDFQSGVHNRELRAQYVVEANFGDAINLFNALRNSILDPIRSCFGRTASARPVRYGGASTQSPPL